MKLPVNRKLRYKVIAGALLIVITFAVFCVKKLGNDSDWLAVKEDTAITENAQNTSESTVNKDSDDNKTENDTVKSIITIDIAGAVAHPSVYILPAESRVYQAVNKAGGLTANADTRNTNLAALLADGTKIYIPSATEVKAEEKATGTKPGNAYIGGSTAATAAAASGTDDTSDSGIININTATSEKLQELPGVGPSTADKIIAYRQKYGAFSKIEELMNVSGIGEKTFAKMQARITV
jgi:competence protein ComEA